MVSCWTHYKYDLAVTSDGVRVSGTRSVTMALAVRQLPISSTQLQQHASPPDRTKANCWVSLNVVFSYEARGLAPGNTPSLKRPRQHHKEVFIGGTEQDESSKSFLIFKDTKTPLKLLCFLIVGPDTGVNVKYREFNFLKYLPCFTSCILCDSAPEWG